MTEHMDWADLFLSWRGRTARGPFWLASTLLLIALFIYEVSANVTVHNVTAWVVYPVFLFCGFCLMAKRMHDRGKPASYCAVALLALAKVWPRPSSPLDFVAVLIIIWATVELAALTGERGANRFGDNPLAPAAKSA